jgi:hypothetical protein
LEIGNTGSLVFEGSTNDGNETTIAVADPTADRTITFPNVTGNVVTTGDTGTVTSTMIANGTIANADINASAAIADTKLATISTAGKVSNSATTATNANTASAIVARDASGNFSAGTITANLTGTASNVTTNANLTGHITSVGNAAVLGSFTSAQLAAALTDETGTGANVFATSPALVTPILGTPTSGNLANCTFPTLNQSTTGNAATATNLSSNRTFALTGEATGSVSSNLASGASIAVTIASGVIDNDNISPTAAIAISKIAALDSSQYTPVAGTFTNLDAATIASDGFQWVRVGQQVMVSGRVAVDATASGDWSFRLSLPVTKSAGFGSTGEANGTGNSRNATEYSAVVQSLTGSTTEITVLGRGSVTSSINVFLNFMYLL